MENYPNFEKEYFSESDDDDFRKKLDYCNFNLNQVQKNSKKTGEVFLSFYPVAKNIRFCSSYMTRNLLSGKKSVISSRFRENEKKFWEKNLKRGPIEPWLWNRGRGEDNYTNQKGWGRYFKSFGSEISLSVGEETLKPGKKENIFYNYIASIGYTFSLTENYIHLVEKYKEEMKWPDDKKILAVQIRRGETCSRDGKKSDRPFFTLNNYIQDIERILNEVKYDYIFIATDSDEEIDEIKKIKPEWKLLFIPIDRKKFLRMEGDIPLNEAGLTVSTEDLEDKCRLNPETVPFIADSCIMDLYFIGISHGYISTISISEFSRCGWYLQIFNNKKITPYINISGDRINMLERDKLLLL